MEKEKYTVAHYENRMDKIIEKLESVELHTAEYDKLMTDLRYNEVRIRTLTAPRPKFSGINEFNTVGI